MIRRLKYSALWLPGLLFLLLSAACGQESGLKDAADEAQTAGKRKIICYDVSVSASYMEDVVSVFNAKSSTTEVEMRYLEDADYEKELQRVLDSGEQADVLWLRQPSKANRMAEDGALRDLSDLVSKSALDISRYGQSLDIVQLDERIYSLPFIQNIWLLFYNRDIFEELKLDEPGRMTWEEYAGLAAGISGTDPAGVRWGGYIPVWVPNLGALELGEYLYGDELTATVDFLKFLDRIYNQDHSHPNPSEMEEIYTPGYTAFLDGQIGMMINGDWTIQILRSLEASREESCNWDAAPLPLTPGAMEGTGVGSNSYLAIYSGSRYPENAFEFLEFCCGEDGASLLSSRYCFPSYFTEDSRENYMRNAGITGAGIFFDAILQNEEGKHVLYQDMREIFDREAVSSLKGEKLPEQAVKDYMDARNALVLKNGEK